MIREIVTDTEVLAQKARMYKPKEDYQIALDLLQTANSLRDNCLGLAAIQIGEPIACIVVRANEDGAQFTVMCNPVIVQKSKTYAEADEGCLSLPGVSTKKSRATWVKIIWTDVNGKSHKGTAQGWFARVIQHEIDHLRGVII